MTPRERRRARRRSKAKVAPVVVAAAVLLFLLVGGVLKISSSSGAFNRAVDRSFAAQSTVVAQDSNRSSAGLDSLLARLSASSVARPELEVWLAALVRKTGSQLSELEAATPPSPGGSAAADLRVAFGLRARAVATMRSALDSLLEMAPLPAGPASSLDVGPAVAGSSPAPISSTQAASELGQVGAMLVRSDSSYARGRRLLAALPGSPRLPRSLWAEDPSTWDAGTVSTLVARVQGSALLYLVRDLTLVTCRVAPGAVPSAVGSGAATVPPTDRLTVTVVVANDGNVAESGVVVSATLQPLGPGSPATARRTVSLAPGTSVTEVLTPLRVRPGTAYSMSGSLTPPEPQTTPVLPCTTELAIAPVAPPTTTTTVPPTTTTTVPRTTTTRTG